jgi:hypothetical protein
MDKDIKEIKRFLAERMSAIEKTGFNISWLGGARAAIDEVTKFIENLESKKGDKHEF